MKHHTQLIIFSIAYIALGMFLTARMLVTPLQMEPLPTYLMVLIPQVVGLAVAHNINLKQKTTSNAKHRDTVYPVARNMVLVAPFIMLLILHSTSGI